MEFKELSKEAFDALTSEQQEFYMGQLKAHKEKELKAKIDEAVKTANEANESKVQEKIEAAIKVVKDEADAKIDAMKAENARIREQAIQNEKEGVHFEKALNDSIEEHLDAIKEVQNDKRAKVKFQLKAVGDMGLSNIDDLSAANVQMASGIYGLPNRRIHMRDILSTGRMTTSDYHYLRETGGEGNVNTWTENSGAKPQLDLDYIEKVAPSQYVAGYLKISRKAMDDITALRAAIQGRLLEKYLVAEDTQIINGNGVSPNLEGILTAAEAYDEANGYEHLVQRIIDAIGQLEEGAGGLSEGFFADGILLKPRDWARIANTTTLDTGQSFTLPGLGIVSMQNGILHLNGVPVYKMNGMPNDPNRQFLVGDWKMGAQLLIREDPTVEFSYENEDDFVQNKITVRVEGRIALPIYYEEAFVKGFIEKPTS